MHFTAFRYAFIVALGGFVFGLDAAIISGTVGFVGTEFNLSDLQVGTVVSAPGFGVLFALLTVGYLSERLGRKRLLQWIAFFYLVSATWSAFAPSYEQLIAARFLGGLAFTSLSLAAMYIGEIAPAHMRGKLVAMNQINIVVGLSAAYFINYFILQASSSGAGWVSTIGLDTNTWRWMLGSEILPAAIWFGLLFFIPKSPRWLVLKGRDEEASMVLAKLSTPEMVRGQLLSIKQSIASSGSSNSVVEQFRKLMCPTMRTILWIGVTFAIVQQITGINAILFYAPTIFEQLGIGTNAAFMNAVFVGLVSLVATACALLFIDTLGRRPMTILGLSVAVISLSICAYGFHSASYTLTEVTVSALPEAIELDRINHLVNQEFHSDVSFKDALRSALGEEIVRDYGSDLMAAAAKLPATLILIGILCFIAAFQFSVGPIMWVVFSEIVSTQVRSVAIPLFAFVTSIVSYLVQQFFPWQLANLGGRDIFLFYATTTAVGLVILYRLLPETKNKSLEEIEKELGSSVAKSTANPATVGSTGDALHSTHTTESTSRVTTIREDEKVDADVEEEEGII